jgi:hypothetical protein
MRICATFDAVVTMFGLFLGAMVDFEAFESLEFSLLPVVAGKVLTLETAETSTIEKDSAELATGPVSDTSVDGRLSRSYMGDGE